MHDNQMFILVHHSVSFILFSGKNMKKGNTITVNRHRSAFKNKFPGQKNPAYFDWIIVQHISLCGLQVARI